MKKILAAMLFALIATSAMAASSFSIQSGFPIPSGGVTGSGTTDLTGSIDAYASASFDPSFTIGLEAPTYTGPVSNGTPLTITFGANHKTKCTINVPDLSITTAFGVHNLPTDFDFLYPDTTAPGVTPIHANDSAPDFYLYDSATKGGDGVNHGLLTVTAQRHALSDPAGQYKSTITVTLTIEP